MPLPALIRRHGMNTSKTWKIALMISMVAFTAVPTEHCLLVEFIFRSQMVARDRWGLHRWKIKIVQHAVRTVLQNIYEQDFLGFSYGYRPQRQPHHALDALAYGIDEKKVNWVLDADIKGFFDEIDRTWLVKFLRWNHRRDGLVG
jgi:Reverse transcriptase (RNA-dependent DNA polymerase)